MKTKKPKSATVFPSKKVDLRPCIPKIIIYNKNTFIFNLL